jgi:hypothetical protein
MKISLIGKIERQPFGPGVWALLSDDGETYELLKPPTELRKDGSRVKVAGTIRSDVMSFAAIGPILEVESFEMVD